MRRSFCQYIAIIRIAPNQTIRITFTTNNVGKIVVVRYKEMSCSFPYQATHFITTFNASFIGILQKNRKHIGVSHKATNNTLTIRNRNYPAMATI